MDTVVIKSVDAGAVRRAMDEHAHRLLSTCPEIEELVVFGSFATGHYAPGSDLDVLVVLSASNDRVRERIARFLPTGGFPVPMDVFPFTRAELAERRPSPVLDAADASAWRYDRQWLKDR